MNFDPDICNQVKRNMTRFGIDHTDDTFVALKRTMVKSRRYRVLVKTLTGIQAQYQAGELSNGKDAACQGAVPLLASWSCIRPSSGEGEFEEMAVMPFVNWGRFEWGFSDFLERSTEELEEDWLSSDREVYSFLSSNLCRLSTLLVVFQAQGLVHGKIEMSHILIQKCSREQQEQRFVFRYGTETVIIPKNRYWLVLTDFNGARLKVFREGIDMQDFYDLLVVFYQISVQLTDKTLFSAQAHGRFTTLLVRLGLELHHLNERDRTTAENVQPGETYESVWQTLVTNKHRVLVEEWFRPIQDNDRSNLVFLKNALVTDVEIEQREKLWIHRLGVDESGEYAKNPLVDLTPREQKRMSRSRRKPSTDGPMRIAPLQDTDSLTRELTEPDPFSQQSNERVKFVKWQDLDTDNIKDLENLKRSYIDTTSFCDQRKTRKILGKGDDGEVYVLRLKELARDFDPSILTRVKANMVRFGYPHTDQTEIVIKKMASDTTDRADWERAAISVRAQYHAGKLANGKNAIAHGIVPIFGAWKCDSKGGFDENMAMPKMDWSVDQFLRLGQHILAEELTDFKYDGKHRFHPTDDTDRIITRFLLSNFLRLATATIVLHEHGIEHNDICPINILVHKCTTAERQQSFQFHHCKDKVTIPSTSHWLFLNDFGWSEINANQSELTTNDFNDLIHVFNDLLKNFQAVNVLSQVMYARLEYFFSDQIRKGFTETDSTLDVWNALKRKHDYHFGPWADLFNNSDEDDPDPNRIDLHVADPDLAMTFPRLVKDRSKSPRRKRDSSPLRTMRSVESLRPSSTQLVATQSARRARPSDFDRLEPMPIQNYQYQSFPCCVIS